MYTFEIGKMKSGGGLSTGFNKYKSELNVL